MNVHLIDCGMLPIDALEEFCLFSDDVKIFCEDDIRYNSLSNLGFNTDRLFKHPCGDIKNEVYFNANSAHIINEIISDHKVFQLFDRTENVFSTTSSKITEISDKCESCIKFIESNDVKYIYFNATPHSCNNWILAKVAELLGVEVFYFKQSIIPWRYNCLSGLNSNPEVLELNDDVDVSEREEIYSYLDNKKKSIEDALPDYERKRLERNKGKIYSIRTEIHFWKRPDLIINKYLCWRKYNKLSSPKPKSKYIIFFLHFQPERTTLPEGYWFTQQILAIKALRRCTSTDTLILVKEHPSTYTNSCHWKERSTEFYRVIASIDGVKLIDINTDQYLAIDDAIAIASITGTVLLESIVRGTPSISFGLAPFIQSDIHHRFTSDLLLRSFINKCLSTKDNNEKGLQLDLEGSLRGTIDCRKSTFKKLQAKTNINHLAAAKGIMKILKGHFDA